MVRNVVLSLVFCALGTLGAHADAMSQATDFQAPQFSSLPSSPSAGDHTGLASTGLAATPSAVTPEPSSLIMIGTGAILSGGMFLRRRRSGIDVQSSSEGTA